MILDEFSHDAGSRRRVPDRQRSEIRGEMDRDRDRERDRESERDRGEQRKQCSGARAAAVGPYKKDDDDERHWAMSMI